MSQADIHKSGACLKSLDCASVAWPWLLSSPFTPIWGQGVVLACGKLSYCLVMSALDFVFPESRVRCVQPPLKCLFCWRWLQMWFACQSEPSFISFNVVYLTPHLRKAKVTEVCVKKLSHDGTCVGLSHPPCNKKWHESVKYLFLWRKSDF